MIGASTRVLVLLGDPTEHSLSPRIQNAGLRSLGLDAVYVALRCDAHDAPGLIRGIARAGGAGNVTLPHKEIAAATVDHPSELVRLTGACNTFWGEADGIHGENTDVAGFRAAVEALLGRSAAGLRVLVVGAGGAARGALAGLLADGVGEAILWNRTGARARALAEALGGGPIRVVEALSDVEGSSVDLLVNATSLGLDDADPLPIEPATMRGGAALLDLVYRPRETRLVREARGLGIRAADGGEMLVCQGAEAFRRWWRREPPIAAMRQALEEVREGPPESVTP
ncbi:MAG: shikimate dehydrogenase [Gemmatimonadota bacterium]